MLKEHWKIAKLYIVVIKLDLKEVFCVSKMKAAIAFTRAEDAVGLKQFVVSRKFMNEALSCLRDSASCTTIP